MSSKNYHRESFGELIEKNQKILHKVCRVYIDNPYDREDLFQEICLQLWRSYPSFREEARLSTWIYKVALNTAISTLRKRNRNIVTVSLKNRDMIQSTELDEKENAELLHRAITMLSRIDKAIILLWLEERSYEEISEILGISKSNVSVKLVRIKKKLIEMINKQH
jgi:RNA polymerase sigma-70 factor (ECF subfamily)